MQNSAPVIEMQNLSVEFHIHEGIVKAVNGLSYSVSAGETLGIVGESGSGKSVSSMAAMDLLPKPPAVIGKNSSIKILGKEMLNLSRGQINRYRGEVMAMIFQDPMTCLNPYVRVDHQMMEGLCFHKNMSKKAARRKCVEMLEYVHIPDADQRIRCYPHELSGGMRQRVMIAMALTCEPKLIFADEPTTALDVTVQAQIMKLFGEIQQRFSMGIVLISHSLGLIGQESDKILVMYAGQMMEFGRPEDIFEATAHPYTIALRQSIPELHRTDQEKDTLQSIDGRPPNLLYLKPGCPFADRCAEVRPQCRTQNIPVKDLGGGHLVRCVL